MGSKRGSFWLKHDVQGLHCVHIRSLPVSAIPTKLMGGLPIEMFIRYSPLLKTRSDCGAFILFWCLKVLMRLFDRRKALAMRSQGFCEGEYKGDLGESRWISSRLIKTPPFSSADDEHFGREITKNTTVEVTSAKKTSDGFLTEAAMSKD